MTNLISKDETKIVIEINAYLEEIKIKAKERLIKLTSPPEDQHMVPRFILNLIAAENPANVTKERGLLLKEYRIEYNPATSQLDFAPRKDLVSPRLYSVRSKIYNSSSFENEFFMEIMFSIIETDAARLIRSKAAGNYDPNKEKEYNPFYFSLPECNLKPSKMRARVILSAFFTIQILRAEHRKDALAAISLKYGMTNTDFAGNIMNNLPSTTKQTYLRQWTWIRVPSEEMIISELGMITVASCDGPVAAIMPISRRDFIYIHEDVESHFVLDDKLVYSTSALLYTWYLKSLLGQIVHFETKEDSDGKSKISFVTNKEAVFGMSSLYNTKGCCMGCHLDFIRTNPKNELFIARDYILE